ncbi:MAG: TolC family protein [Elusimicrobiota bacterium]|nr:MAG: TolC family protein [Elusimicrobiota bacterium]
MAVSMLLACPGLAQESAPSAKKYALAELVVLALKSTPFLAAQDARLEEKTFSAAQARVWQGPSVGLLFGRTKQTQASGSRYELSLAQPIPLTGIPGLRGRLLSLESESLLVQRAASEVLVTLSVAQGAYEYAASRRKAAFAESRRKRFQLIESYLAGRVFATPQRMAESRIVTNRVKNLVAEAIRGEAGYKASLEKLKAFVPLDSGAYPDIDVPWLSGARGLDEKEWMDKILVDNPELRAQRLTVQGAGLEKTLASRAGLPDAALIASYEKGQADIIGTAYGLGLSFGFPSWNRNRSGIKSAEQRKIASERQLSFAEQRLRAELSRALVEYEAARQVVLKYPSGTMAELEGQLKGADEGFRKGQVDLLTFLELDGSAAETYGLALDAQADLAAKAAEVLALTADRDALTKLASF